GVKSPLLVSLLSLAVVGIFVHVHVIRIDHIYNGIPPQHQSAEDELETLSTASLPSWATTLVPSGLPQPSPSSLPTTLDGSWRPKTVEDFNRLHEAALESCLQGRQCAKNQEKLVGPFCRILTAQRAEHSSSHKPWPQVILAYGHFIKTIDGEMQGEHILCDSMINAIHALGYSMLIIPESQESVAIAWRKYYHNVQLIIWEDQTWSGGECIRNSTCVFSDSPSHASLYLPPLPPNGTHLNIPLWKVFNINWWGSPTHPLGGPFTLSPENYAAWPSGAGRGNLYIGYSLESTCLKTQFIHSSTGPAKQPYILRSDSGAVEDRVETDVFSKLSEDANVTFLASMAHNAEGLSPPKGIVQLPRLGRTEFREALANNRVVVGLGNPALSPTPWEALCMGVPFINPVFDWDRDHPEDKTKWNAQQNGVMYLCLDEPHVYHVKCGDRAGFEQAVRKAMDSPIDR
ncbi:hypothetical protein FRB97_008122, partial [Tulasnella sp. 331]